MSRKEQLTDSSRYRTSLVDTMEGFARLSESWNGLLAESRASNVFLTWEWLYTWAEHYLGDKRRLFVVTVYDRGELIGIAPFYITCVRESPFVLRQVEFLGAPETASDYLDVFTRRGAEKKVASLVYHFLFSVCSSEWDTMHLRDIPSTSIFFLHFIDELKKRKRYYEINAASYCPTLTLDGRCASYANLLSSKRRKNLAYGVNVLKRGGGFRYYSIDRPDHKGALKSFLALYRKRWRNNDNKRFCEFLEAFTERVRSRDVVTLDFLNVGETDIAGLFFLKYGKKIYMYLMAVDVGFNRKISIGNILTGLSIERAFGNGFSTYDFLKGGEEYKFYWASGGNRSLSLFTSQRSPGALFIASKKFLRSIVKILRQ